jgi:hypothetical protein
MTSARLDVVVRCVIDNSLLLLAGTLAAVVWANIDFAT